MKAFLLGVFQTAYVCRFALWLVTGSALAAAQAPLAGDIALRSPLSKGSTELGFSTGAGVRIAGGFPEGNFWAAQLRWGRVLTAPRGPGLLRGSLLYAVEVVPALVMVQSSTVFGGGFTPVLLQYSFAGRNASQRRFVPFVQAGAGMLFTTEDVPRDTAQFNFTPQGGVGVHWMHDPQSSLVFGLRYHHISNASRDRLNPGHNAIYFYTGLSWWR